MPGFEATKNEAGQDLEFVATFEVYPEVELSAFDSIEVEKPKAEVTDADVDTMIETLRQQRAQFEEVERAAENGDRVNIDFKGLKDNEAFEGGTAEGQNLELGSGQMIPGFEDGIVGMKPGEEKDIEVTFPEDYQSEELKGQAVVFQIKVNKVEGKALPEVDAEFMKAFGVEDGDEAKFKAEVRKNMERELKNAVTGKVKEQAMDGLVKLHEFDLPEALVTQEIQRMRQQMMQQFGGGQQFDALGREPLFEPGGAFGLEGVEGVVGDEDTVGGGMGACHLFQPLALSGGERRGVASAPGIVGGASGAPPTGPRP